jgi:hypothetical protein
MKWPWAVLIKLYQLWKLFEIVLYICSQGFVTRMWKIYTAGWMAVTGFMADVYKSMLH